MIATAAVVPLRTGKRKRTMLRLFDTLLYPGPTGSWARSRLAYRALEAVVVADAARGVR